MGHRRSKDRNTNGRNDDASDISTDSEVLRQFIKKSSVVARPINLSPPKPLKLLEDRRAWHPSPLTRNAEALPKRASRLVVPARTNQKPNHRTALPPQVGFAAPKAVAVCVRRHTRRAVLFAKNLTRKGSGSSRRRNEWSNVKC